MSRSEKRFEIEELGQGFYRVILRYGFMEEIDVPAALAQRQGHAGRSSR